MVRTSHHTRRSRVSRRRRVSRTRRSRTKTIRGGARRSKRAEKHTRGGVDYKKVAALGTAAVVAGLGLRALTRRTKRRAPVPDDSIELLLASIETSDDFIKVLNSVCKNVQPCKKADEEDELVHRITDATRTKVNLKPPSKDRDKLLTNFEELEKYYELVTAFRARNTPAGGYTSENELSPLISEVEAKLGEVTPEIVFTVKYLETKHRICHDAKKVEILEDLSKRLKEVLYALPPCTSKTDQNLITYALKTCATADVRLNPVQTFLWKERLEHQITDQIRADDDWINSLIVLEELYNLDPCAQTHQTVDALITSFNDVFERVTSFAENDIERDNYRRYLDNLQKFVTNQGLKAERVPTLQECAKALETLKTTITEEERADLKTKILDMWKALSGVSSRSCKTNLVKTALRRVTHAEAHHATETHNAVTRGQ